MSYLKDSSYQLLGELSIRLIDLTELTDFMGENLWDFQLNSEVAQQPREDQPLLNLVEILNISSENGRESSLNILLEEVLTVDVVEKPQ